MLTRETTEKFSSSLPNGLDGGYRQPEISHHGCVLSISAHARLLKDTNRHGTPIDQSYICQVSDGTVKSSVLSVWNKTSYLNPNPRIIDFRNDARGF